MIDRTANNFIQDKQLLNDMLERHYFSKFRLGEGQLELFLTGACKANCDYCYLKKHQKDLYPVNLHNNDTIIKNLRMVLEWYIENNFSCCLDIFSAEWITTPLADKVIDTIISAFEKVPLEKRPPMIIAADNMQFLKNEEYTKKVEDYISRLNTIGIRLQLSASVDGKYCDYGRTENSDEFYKKLNEFLVKYNYQAHPMVSSDNIKYWINNYLWWQENFDKSISDTLLTLEVRDNTWTTESINYLIRYCDFLIDYIFVNKFDCNKLEFLKYILNINDFEQTDSKMPRSCYNIIGFNQTNIEDNFAYTRCSFHGSLPIRLGDLSIGLCHRTWYPELQVAQMEIDNNKIIGIDPVNVALLILKTRLSKTCLPHCENCKFIGICPGHCLGASYEEYENLLVPQMEVCQMYRAKCSFLIYKYRKMGLFEEIEKLKDHFSPEYFKYFKNLIDTIPNFEESESNNE